MRKKYVYFVSFSFPDMGVGWFESGASRLSISNKEVELSEPITSLSQIRTIENLRVKIISFQLLRTEEIAE